ncbi:6,7-dimethyl-8-ribityllumazine synthase [Candidatus Dependentiae bacterium]|nr:6,7-dimethyl-8-ribityllumazine synthase [Candidatus Dependentiae bacterium]
METNNIKKIEGNFIGKDLKIGIVISRFNEFITSKLLGGCIDGLVRHGVNEKDIIVYWTAGAFEIPATAKIVALSKEKFDAVICLGAVIRGETPHFDYVAGEVSKGVAMIGLETQKPVIYGIITVDTVDQAIDRAGVKTGNKGFDAAVTAIEQANLFKLIK